MLFSVLGGARFETTLVHKNDSLLVSTYFQSRDVGHGLVKETVMATAYFTSEEPCLEPIVSHGNWKTVRSQVACTYVIGATTLRVAIRNICFSELQLIMLLIALERVVLKTSVELEIHP